MLCPHTRSASGTAGRLALAAAVAGFLAVQPGTAGAEPWGPGAATGIPVDRSATRSAAEQFLPGEPVSVDWEDPDPDIERSTGRLRAISRRDPRPEFFDRPPPPDLPDAGERAVEARRRLLEARQDLLERRLDSLPRQSTARRLLEPGRSSQERAREMTLDLERRNLEFEQRMLSGPSLAPRSPGVGLRPGTSRR